MSKIYLTACIGLDHDIVLLDQFCTHYKSLGIDPRNFLLVLNTSNFGRVSQTIVDGLQILAKHGIEPLDVWCTRYESHEKWQRVHNLLNKAVQPQDWVVHPDADEFHDIPTNTYKELFEDFDKKGINALQGLLVDRIAADYKVPESNIIKNAFKEFPVSADLNSLLKLSGVKLMAYRGYMRANNGSGQIHKQFKNSVVYPHGKSLSFHETQQIINLVGDPDYNNREREPEEWTDHLSDIKDDVKYLVHHFKWHGRVIEKLKERVETYTQLQRAQVGQSIRVLEHYEKNGCFKLTRKKN